MPGEESRGIGDKGELMFASRLPGGWIWQPPRLDVGKDGLIVIRDDSELHNIEFAVQVKSSKKLKITKKSVTVKDISKSSVYYWFASPLLTLIVAVDVEQEKAWYSWHLDLFASPKEIQKYKNDVTIHIPIEKRLNKEAWNNIRIQLFEHYRSIQEVLNNHKSYMWLMALVSVVTTASRNLVKLSQSEVPNAPLSEEDGITLLIEQQQHQNILAVANKFMRSLGEDSSVKKQLSFWKESYSSMLVAMFPLINIDAVEVCNRIAEELAVNLKFLGKFRNEVIFPGFDLVAVLSGYPSKRGQNVANN